MSNSSVDCSNDDAVLDGGPERAIGLLEMGASHPDSQTIGGTEVPSRAPGEPIAWLALHGRAPIRTWWIPQFLTPAPTLLAGAGGSGKSLLMQTLCTSLATGRPYFAPVEKPLTCLIWSCEDDRDEVWRRQDRINEHFKITKRDLSRLYIVPRVGMDNTLLKLRFGQPVFTPLLEELREQVQRLNVDVLVLDNIAHLYGGTFDGHQVTQFVNAVAGLVTDRPFAPIFIGHVSRTQGSEFAGAAAWENSVRSRWYLDQEHLKSGKANYCAKTLTKLNFENGLLVPENARSAADQKRRMANAKEVLRDGIEALRQRDKDASNQVTSSNYLPRLLTDPEIALARGFSKNELEAALRQLEISGQLVKREVKRPNGKKIVVLTDIDLAAADLPFESAA
jgi:RecA-family ATPase